MAVQARKNKADYVTSMLDILIVNFNTANLLPAMFESCQQATGDIDVRYWVVDNASQDNSASVLREHFPYVGLVENKRNIGFGRANNQLLPHVTGDYVLLLNTDAFVAPDTLQRTLAYMESNPQCGVLGVKLLGRNGDLQPSCRYFPTPWNVFLARTGLIRLFPKTRMVDDMNWDHASVRECDWVPGCYYLIRRQVLDEVGLFDPRYFLYYEEVDHCKRVKEAGWQVIYFPDTSVVHIGGESAKSAGNLSENGRQLSVLQIESELLYFRKQFGIFGTILHLLLATLGNLYLFLKDILKNRTALLAIVHLKHLFLTFRLFKATAWGRKSTH